MQWEEFTQALCVRFGPSDYEDFDEALTKVRQIGTVREYQMLFERLAARVQDWPQRAMVGSYIGGLKEEIRSEVKLFGPTTLLHATSLARFQEEKLQRLKRVPFPSKSAPLPTTQPALLPTPPSRWSKAGTSPSSTPLVHELKAAPHSKSFLGQRWKHKGMRDYVTTVMKSLDRDIGARHN